MKKIFIAILLGLFLTGCLTQPKHPSIFENPVCEPPCWMNITPGVTTKADALAILSNLDAVDQQIFEENKPYVGFDDTIHFAIYKNAVSGWLYISDEQVSIIGFEYNLDITLQKATELFGAPQNILTIYAGEFDAVTLINSDKGIAYGYRFHLDDSTEIKPTNEILSVNFFDPKKYQLLLDTGILSYHQLSANEILKQMRPWEGYGSFYQYYFTPTQP